MKLYARLVVALGFPIAAACTLSLPLILLGAVAPDPRPWNWPTVYSVDFLYVLALFLLVGSSVAYAYSQKGTLISQKTEELPDGNIYVEELYEIDQ